MKLLKNHWYKVIEGDKDYGEGSLSCPGNGPGSKVFAYEEKEDRLLLYRSSYFYSGKVKKIELIPFEELDKYMVYKIITRMHLTKDRIQSDKVIELVENKFQLKKYKKEIFYNPTLRSYEGWQEISGKEGRNLSGEPPEKSKIIKLKDLPDNLRVGVMNHFLRWKYSLPSLEEVKTLYFLLATKDSPYYEDLNIPVKLILKNEFSKIVSVNKPTKTIQHTFPSFGMDSQDLNQIDSTYFKQIELDKQLGMFVYEEV